MLATQLLLCQGALAMPAPQPAVKPSQCSPRGVLLIIRKEFYSVQQSKKCRDRRRRKSAKKKGEDFPGWKPHTPPEPPVILPLPDDLKSKAHK